MPYYLKHYFMPDFNHKRLRPMAMADGNTAMHYLGYVQNVVAGQVLAELIYMSSLPEGFRAQDRTEPPVRAAGEALPIPVEQGFPEQEKITTTFEQEEQEYWNFLQNLGKIDRRFIYNNPIFPMGPNCGRDPDNPGRIIALANGYVFYHQGLITVKKLLNVRQDVDFGTGNISFVGDMIVHGDVHPGFSLTGGGILIKGRFNGVQVKARGNVVAHKGVKGSPQAHVRAGQTTRVANCERATIITPGHLIIDGIALHSNLVVGGSLIVNGRLQGGSVYANGVVYVKEKLGHSQGAPTKITLGYNPVEYLRLQEILLMAQAQERKLESLAKQSRKGPQFAEDLAPHQEFATRKLEILTARYKEGWRKLTANARKGTSARVIVPGIIYPGVEISIGRAYHNVIDEQQNVFYSLQEEEVVQGFPAIVKGWVPLPGGGSGEDAKGSEE